MRKASSVLVILVSAMTTVFAQQDVENCKDPQLFPNRMPNYLVSDCQSNFDAVDFDLASGGTNVVTKEGTKTRTNYDFNGESGKSKPSALQILRNYEAAVKKIGGETMWLSATEGKGVFKIIRPGTEVWVKLEEIGNDNSDSYVLTILEIENMKQEVTADDILKALNTDGHLALYIHFETGKSAIQPESQVIIDQLTEMLTMNPSLRVRIEGHTDDEGDSPSNQRLSESRAGAVMNAIVSKGVDQSRLSSKGWGQTKPIESNQTEEGKAKNRRVEIVKL